MSSCLRRLKVVVATLAAVAASSAIGQTRTDPTLDRLAAEFQAAYNRGDVEAAASFYAEDAVLMPPNRPITLGRVAITAALRRNLESDPAKMLLRPTESAIAGGHAYEVGTRVMTWPSGTTLNEKYTRIFKRVRDEWKMVYFIWNSDSAAGPPR
jgi:ketosteroid isomerase-like protein